VTKLIDAPEEQRPIALSVAVLHASFRPIIGDPTLCLHTLCVTQTSRGIGVSVFLERRLSGSRFGRVTDHGR